MKILDCENIESAYNSLKQILDLARTDIEMIFSHLNFDDFYRDHPSINQPEDVFVHILEEQGSSDWQCDYVCRFHITRTSPENRFENGLLPLNEVVPSIWDFLFHLVKDDFDDFNGTKWNAFRKQFESNSNHCHSDEIYNLKMNNSRHWGPYGFLIKEVAFRAESVGNWDYLKYPEIVYNISSCFQRRFKIDLLEKYTKATKPCIVKFKDQNFKSVYIGIALVYLYCLYNKFDFYDSCNYSFSGKGQKVDKANILNIEFLY